MKNEYRIKYMRYFSICALLLMAFVSASAADMTQAEQDYVKAHPVIKYTAASVRVPFFFMDGGKAAGFSAEYIALLAQKAGLTAQYTTKVADADVTVDADKASGGQYTYVGPFYTDQYIFAGKDADFVIRDKSNLSGKSVAVVAGSRGETIVKNFKGMKVVSVPNDLEAIKDVQYSRTDLALVGRAETGYLIKQNSIIGMVAAFNPNVSDDLYMAVGADKPELASILGKAADMVTPQETKALKDKWMPPVMERGKRPADVDISAKGLKQGNIAVIITVLALMAVVSVAIRRRKKK